MRVIVQTPTEMIADMPAATLVLETAKGLAGIRPRHADICTIMPAGIATLHTPQGREHYIAHSGGSFVKCGTEARLAVGDAVFSADLSELKSKVTELVSTAVQDERRAQLAATRLEAATIRRLINLERRHARS